MRQERGRGSGRERLNRAVRKVDETEWRTRQEIRNGADNLFRDPDATPVEFASEVVFILGQRALKWPIALIAGVEEFFRKS